MVSCQWTPEPVKVSVPGAKPREGWLFPGLVGRLSIVVCHGYGSSRGELLTLVSALQDHQYNVFVFDFVAHGANNGITSFGYHEADEVRAAIDELARRSDVNPDHFGLWGYNLGAYAALREAENDKRVHALIVDSVYDSPEQMVKIGVEKQGLGGIPRMARSAEMSFGWINHKYRGEKALSWKFDTLAGVPKLFIEAADYPDLADITPKIFKITPEPNEQVKIPHGNFVERADDHQQPYENRLVTHLLLRAPP